MQVPLEQLEADLAAVQSAMETLDRIAAEGTGASAAEQISAVVSPARFPLAEDPAEPAGSSDPDSDGPARPATGDPQVGGAASDLVGDGLLHEQVHPGAEEPFVP